MKISKIGININKFRAASAGIGDSICCTPALRKISQSFDCMIQVHSWHPEIFNKLPYVSSSHMIVDEIDNNYHFTVYSAGTREERGERMNHNLVDTRQFPALQCGFQLLPNEMHCDYVPVESFNIDVPDEYVVVHAPNSWPVKSWDIDKWQELCNNIKLPIISIGKDCSIGDWHYTFSELNNVIDLVDQTSLDQTWHICNNAKYVITTDSGILHLSGTTETEIIYIAIGRHPFLTCPYRHGSQDYKMKIISNNCDFCMSNHLMLSRAYQSTDLRNCYINDNDNSFCQPSVDQVLEAING